MGKRADNSDRGVLITLEAARRIGRAVQSYEHGRRNQPGIKLRTAWGDGEADDQIRLGRVSSSWAKGNTATVEELDEDGNPLSPSVTFQAKNWFINLTVGAGYRKVACALSRGVWILIAAEC